MAKKSSQKTLLSCALAAADHGVPLYAENSAQKHRPASLTKLLTLILVIDRLRSERIGLEYQIRIPDDAISVDSWWGFEAGTEVTVGNLMKASIVVSANEASNALAEWHSGTIARFTRALNKLVADIGLRDTKISSPSGLGRDQSTTVNDMVSLARYILSKYPEIVDLCSERSFEWNGKRFANTNRLLEKVPGALGLKTGSLGGRSFNLLFVRKRGEEADIAVVLGASSRDTRDKKVLELLEKVDVSRHLEAD